MSEREQHVGGEGKERVQSESFVSRLGKRWEEGLNGVLEEVPGFSDNGISLKEKDLYRATLTFRIFNAVVSEMVKGGRGKLANFFSELVEGVAREQADIYESLCDETGNLPSEIEKRLHSIRK